MPNKGYKYNQDFRDKCRERMLGTAGRFKGKKHSKETKEKISLIGKGRKLSEETKKKIRLCQKGSKSSRWKGGITQDSRYTPQYYQYRLQVLQRDNFTCQKCFIRGGKLEVHHLEGFLNNKKLRYEISNGITLCNKCHKLFHKLFGKGNNTSEQFIKFLC